MTSDVTPMTSVGEIIDATGIKGVHGPRHTAHVAAMVQANPYPQPASPLDLPADVFNAGLERRKSNRAALLEWVRAALVEGVDFGKVHIIGKNKCAYAARGEPNLCPDPTHWTKPSLFKPGAEKICGMLGVTIHFPSLHDYEQAALHGVVIKNVIIRCEIRDAAGRVVADGVGARALAQDFGDINKSLKMAEKSAHIDATLRMAGLSEIFTQDVEDMKFVDPDHPQTTTPGQSPASGPRDRWDEPERVSRRISTAQKKRLEARIGEIGLDQERVKAWVAKAWGVEHFADLTPEQYVRLDTRLDIWAQAVDEAARAAEGGA